MTGPDAAQLKNLLAEAAAHYHAGRWREAEAAYRAALDLGRHKAPIMHNLGIIAAGAGDPVQAIKWFDQVIEVEPGYAAAHANRAVALLKLGRRQEAIAGFTRATSLEPDNYAAHRALGFLFLAEGNRGRALDHFARTYELRRGDDRIGIARQSLDQANRCKLRHDAEQFRYLAKGRRDGARFEMLARAYEAGETRSASGLVTLSSLDLDALGEDYNTAINIAEAPEIKDGAVNRVLDRHAILQRFERTGAAPFDEFLSLRAFAALRDYLLRSTIWHDFNHIGGFVASYLEDGLACPLVLQIADELRTAFPTLLGQHPLSQAWAFKAVEPKAAVDIHSDDGAVSINFWMTPAEASCGAAEHGGLGVCLAPPPADWSVRDYDQDKTRAAQFLASHNREVEIVPYRANRAVLFKSRLLHWSDTPEFAEGYENHRINVTLLFG
jgi:tetratricopeptide (TPR) repeat protein